MKQIHYQFKDHLPLLTLSRNPEDKLLPTIDIKVWFEVNRGLEPKMPLELESELWMLLSHKYSE